MFFGKYSPTNDRGLNFDKMPAMIGGLIIGSLLSIILFGAIAILISAIAGKVVIMIGTIGIAIVINVLYSILPVVTTMPDDYVRDNFSISLNTHRYVGLDGKMHDAVNASHVRKDGEPNQ
jgi:hypothetical protein